jgi:mRNA-degrading endonuclease RelE of RelBE toxin-antitoxin system
MAIAWILRMMADPDHSPCPFTVEITPTAWKQIARLHQETYRVLRERLCTLADMASAGQHPFPVPTCAEGVVVSLSFVVDDFAALYEVDTHSRILRLLEVARRLSTDTSKDHSTASIVHASGL